MGASENLQDTWITIISVIIFATAVTLAVAALGMLRRINTVVSERVDEKQSITTTLNNDIAESHTFRTDVELSKNQVFQMILDSSNSSNISINGTVIPIDTVKNARGGINKSVLKIKGLLLNDKYYMKTFYDTNGTEDYVTGIEFYIP